MSDRVVKRALISVFDKTGLIDFGKALVELGVEIISSGGTANALQEAGIAATPVEKVTGFPEMMNGRVKTLHPMIHAGILADRNVTGHMVDLERHQIEPVDLVCVNLYPFVKVTSQKDCSFADAIENIDIGGPSMLRSAAKNHAHVVVLTSVEQYQSVIDQMRANNGCVDGRTRLALAQKAFELTAEYDVHIQQYLKDHNPDRQKRSPFDGKLLTAFSRQADLRYGENPHQKAALYLDVKSVPGGWSNIKQLSGKELSFNNIVDANAALELIMEFNKPAACVIKHTNPCGAAVSDDIVEAYRKAYLGDPIAAMGGIVAVNRTVEADLAEAIVDCLQRWGRDAGAGAFFAEIIIAPHFASDAVDVLTTRKKWGQDVRLLQVEGWDGQGGMLLDDCNLSGWDLKRVRGGLLAQSRDQLSLNQSQWQVVSKTKPTEQQLEDLRLAWLVCKHVKSNAIVLVKDGALVGAGAGQMSRVTSSRLAAELAGDRARGSVLASDAFFPFRDGVDAAVAAGATAVIEPGGSKKDQEVIAAADEHSIPMIFTGVRHFKH